MDWTDDGIVLSTRKHGETSAIVHLLTRQNGVAAGLVRGGTGKRARGQLQPGNLLHAHWRGRLPEHLGTLTCEMSEALGAGVMDDAAALAAVGSACALTLMALPEHEAHPAVFDGLLVLLRSMDEGSWPTVYVKWELGLLQELGFGLDFSECAATGETEDLVYVSPKSGRAVSGSAGEPYKGKLLPLPVFLLDGGAADSADDIQRGLQLTGHFLAEHVLKPAGRALPDARQRLLRRLRVTP